MPSPFPGVNPYLEQEDAWREFHERFLPHAAECLSPQVSPAYVVKLAQNLYIHERVADQRHLPGYGDVTISRTRAPRPASAATAVLQARSRILLPSVDVESESYLEIRDSKTRRLVTSKLRGFRGNAPAELAQWSDDSAPRRHFRAFPLPAELAWWKP
jgi:hypothetical protein